MLTFAAAAAAGLVCGVLSGFGIGGGSLLMVWMTAVLSMEQKAAQGVNLLYFLPCAACALIFHIKNKQIVWRAVWPAALAGSVCAVGGATVGTEGGRGAAAEAVRRLSGSGRVVGDSSEGAEKGVGPARHTAVLQISSANPYAHPTTFVGADAHIGPLGSYEFAERFLDVHSRVDVHRPAGRSGAPPPPAASVFRVDSIACIVY